MPSARAVLATASAAVSVLVAAAPAGAANVATSPCIRGGEGQPIIGTGFTPGARVTLSTTNSTQPVPRFSTAVIADAAGNFVTMSSPPPFNPFRRTLQTFELTATDGTNPANTATATFQKVIVSYAISSGRDRPTSKVTHSARGFEPGRNVYVHFRFGGKTRRSVKIGKAKGACGVISRRFSRLPTRVRVGRWTSYADQRPRYSRKTEPQARIAFRIYRRYF